MILVTGGLGYIGSHVNKKLHIEGFETIVLDNLITGHLQFGKWGNVIVGDLSNLDQLKFLFKQYPIKAVIHLAASAYVGESVSNPEKYYYNNVLSTLNLLQVMIEAKVTNIVYSSTCSTYGIPIKVPITEDHFQNPINPYGNSKFAVENILKDYRKAYGINYVIYRFFNVAGASIDSEIGEWHVPETHLIPLALSHAKTGAGSINIFGTDYTTYDGTCIRDYIHVEDIACAHFIAIRHLLSGGDSDVFNLGNGNGFSVRDVLDRVQAVTGKKLNIVITDRRDGDPEMLIANYEKAKSHLKWQPQYTNIDDIIRSAWKWYLNLNSALASN